MSTFGPSTNMDTTKDTWQCYVFSEDSLRFFDESSTINNLEYQDINRSLELRANLCGVIEHSGTPLIYIAQSDSLTGHRPSSDINSICHLLACRGDEVFLAEISGGTLYLYPCLLQDSSHEQQSFTIDIIPSLVRGLSEGLIPTQLAEANKRLKEIKLRKKMLEAFMQAASHLRASRGLEISDDYDTDNARLSTILALLGRVLFMCFLCDRNLSPQEFSAPRTNPFDKFALFTDPQNAANICYWQDITFNGDFLPILDDNAIPLATESDYLAFFQKHTVLQTLQSFTNGESNEQLSLIRLLDFKHVPIGLLSEVYETFAHRFFEKVAHSTSIHYTPRHIAAVLIGQAFKGIAPQERSNVCVLDPSAGAGVFLVLTLQKIIQEKISVGVTITAPLIRSVLYNQIRGMDISIHALRLSTLALYLAAIDLDPNPSPVTKQHFDKPLLGNVLHYVSDEFGIGALGDKGTCQALTAGPFDLVVGNPPWTKLDTPEQQKAMRKRTIETAHKVRQDIQTHLEALKCSPDDLSPDFNPAFPFLWKCLEWAKRDGIIALALPAEQILFREHKSRNILFRNLQVTGIINGSDLHKTSFWEGMEEPFCLFFARNNIPNPDDSFIYLNVFVESLTSRQHRIRLDSSQSRNIIFDWLEQTPYLLKTLFRGTELDLSIIERMNCGPAIQFGQFLRNNNLDLCNGYAKKGLAKTDTKIKKQILNYEMLKSLNGLHLTAGKGESLKAPLLQDSILEEFNNDTTIHYIDAPRAKELYAPPLFIIPQATGQGALFYTGHRNVIFSQSYFGVSFAQHRDGRHIAAYLTIIFQSELPKYYALLTSARYGTNWNTVLLEEYDKFPIIPWESLDKEEKDFCSSVISEWENGRIINKDEIFAWSCNIYKINKYEQKIIKDTLNIKAPGQRTFAQSQPTLKVKKDFLSHIEKDIITLSRIYNNEKNFSVEFFEENLPGWIFANIKTKEEKCCLDNKDILLNLCTSIANSEGCSQIIIPDHQHNHIIFGLLDQNRYWAYTNARLFSQKIRAELDQNRHSWGLE